MAEAGSPSDAGAACCPYQIGATLTGGGRISSGARTMAVGTELKGVSVGSKPSAAPFPGGIGAAAARRAAAFATTSVSDVTCARTRRQRAISGLLAVLTTIAGVGLTLLVSAPPAAAVVNGWTGYAANYTSGTGTSVTPFNTNTNAAAADVTGVGTAPRYVAISNDGATAYVVGSSTNTLTPITVATGVKGSALALGISGAWAIAMTPDGTTAYVTNASSSGSIVPVTLSTMTVGTPIAVGAYPRGIVITPDGSTAFVANLLAGTVTPVDLGSGVAGTPITVGLTSVDPLGMAITPNGATLFVANSGTNTVSWITISTLTVGGTITVGTAPFGIAITPDGTTAFVSNTSSGTVSWITISTKLVGGTITVGSGPSGIAITPDGATVYEANKNANNVGRITVSSKAYATGSEIAVGTTPQGIAIAPDQAPTATLAATPVANPGTSTFSSAGSSSPVGTIASYAWNFGDGNTSTSANPSHAYAAGHYTVTLTVTNSAGTSTADVFTGNTMSNNGGASATMSVGITIGPFLGWVSPAPDFTFGPIALNGTDQTTTATQPLEIANTYAAGWNITLTSTTFTSGAHTLATTATKVNTAPAKVCIVAGCTLATNSVTYPYTVPAGTTAPTATKMFNAATSTGIGDQTITPTYTLSAAAAAYAGTYTSTWTLTLVSGP
jgi:YVTN family beta-propeller protein